MDPESNDLIVGGSKRLHFGDHAYVLFPAFSGTSSDPAVCIVGDGGDFRLAAVSVGVGTCTLTITRASDGATADVEVTVTAAPEPEPFEVHLGEAF
jgi:hypothetical protein